MTLSRHLSRSGLRELAGDLRFLGSREARARALSELDEATTADELLAAVNRTVPGGASQVPEEILGFIGFVGPRAPKTLVEIGAEAGGTHVLLGRALPSLEQTIAVDLRVRNRLAVRGLRREGLRTDLLEGSSSDPQTFERVRSALGGRPIDILFIDGDHSFRGAASDFLSYRPLVRPGGLIAFHDIVPDGWLRTGTATSAYGGEVPLIWKHLRDDFTSHEFVASWGQEGKGIGVIENDPGVTARLLYDDYGRS